MEDILNPDFILNKIQQQHNLHNKIKFPSHLKEFDIFDFVLNHKSNISAFLESFKKRYPLTTNQYNQLYQNLFNQRNTLKNYVINSLKSYYRYNSIENIYDSLNPKLQTKQSLSFLNKHITKNPTKAIKIQQENLESLIKSNPIPSNSINFETKIPISNLEINIVNNLLKLR